MNPLGSFKCKYKSEILKGFLVLFLFVAKTSFPFFNNLTVNSSQNKTPVNLEFIENKGQMKGSNGKVANNVLFKSQLQSVDIFVTDKGLSYVFIQPTIKKKQTTSLGLSGKIDNAQYNYSRFDIELKGGRIDAKNILTEYPSGSFSNYFNELSSEGFLNVKSYGKITVKNLYEGIDWVLYGNEKGLKYDFIVHPNADPDQIKLIYRSLDSITQNKDGIKIATPNGIFFEKNPFSYVNSKENEIISSYKINKTSKLNKSGNIFYETEVVIETGVYDKAEKLIIDPLQLMWGTYYGGTMGSEGTAITTDSLGNVFVLGNTNSPNFPVQPYDSLSYFQGTYGGAINGGGLGDAFIVKFTNNGELIWATYFGGSCIDNGTGIKCDKQGNIFVTGTTYSTDFPIIDPGGNAYVSLNNSSSNWIEEIFVSKFSNNGRYLWSTYFGTPEIDVANALAIDSNNDVYVTGSTNSASFPVFDASSGNFFQNTFGGGLFNPTDAIILKFSNKGELKLSSYFGGSSEDKGMALANDQLGNIYVAVRTASSDITTFNPGSPAFNQSSLASSGGNPDYFILMLDSVCNLKWSTYLGGLGMDVIEDAICDKNNNLIVTGFSYSNNFPVVNPGGGAFFLSPNLQATTTISKFSPFHEMNWSTFYGTGGGQYIHHLSIGVCNELYLSFACSPFNNMPVNNPNNTAYIDSTYNNDLNMSIDDIFISCFTGSGAQKWGTFFGGKGVEEYMCITNDHQGNLFYTGQQGSAYYQNNDYSTYTSNCIIDPGNNTYFQPLPLDTSGNSQYCVIGKFKTPKPEFSLSASGCGSNDTAAVQLSDGFSPFTYNWNNSSTNDSINNVGAGHYYCTVTDSWGCIASDSIWLGVPNIVIDSTAGVNLCPGQSTQIILDGANSFSWQPNTGISAINNNIFNVSPITATNYTITGYTSATCSSSSIITIDLYDLPIISVSGEDSICNGTSTTLTVSGTENYYWSPQNNLNIIQADSVVASPNSSETYIIKGASENGCIDSISYDLIVIDNPNLQVSGQTQYCIGDSTNLVASGANELYWLNTQNQLINDSSIIIDEATSSTYQAIGINMNKCIDTLNINITVNPLPTVEINLVDSICKNLPFTLSATGIGSLDWSSNVALSCYSCSSPQTSITENSFFFIMLIDSNGCKNTDSLTVYVKEDCESGIFIPNVFSPNGDGINDLFSINAVNMKSVSGEIYNRWGQKVVEIKTPELNWNGLLKNGKTASEGTYYYIVRSISIDDQEKIFKGFLTLAN